MRHKILRSLRYVSTLYPLLSFFIVMVIFVVHVVGRRFVIFRFAFITAKLHTSMIFRKKKPLILFPKRINEIKREEQKKTTSKYTWFTQNKKQNKTEGTVVSNLNSNRIYVRVRFCSFFFFFSLSSLNSFTDICLVWHFFSLALFFFLSTRLYHSEHTKCLLPIQYSNSEYADIAYRNMFVFGYIFFFGNTEKRKSLYELWAHGSANDSVGYFFFFSWHIWMCICVCVWKSNGKNIKKTETNEEGKKEFWFIVLSNHWIYSPFRKLFFRCFSDVLKFLWIPTNNGHMNVYHHFHICHRPLYTVLLYFLWVMSRWYLSMCMLLMGCEFKKYLYMYMAESDTSPKSYLSHK